MHILWLGDNRNSFICRADLHISNKKNINYKKLLVKSHWAVLWCEYLLVTKKPANRPKDRSTYKSTKWKENVKYDYCLRDCLLNLSRKYCYCAQVDCHRCWPLLILWLPSRWMYFPLSYAAYKLSFDFWAMELTRTAVFQQ